MSDPFIGEIRINSFSFAPRGWAACDGQQMAISQNQALFALLGVKFGGDAKTYFNLPDLQGRIPVNEGRDNVGKVWAFAERAGSETATLTVANLPQHTHTVNAVNAVGDKFLPSASAPPTPGVSYALAQPEVGNAYASTGSTVALNGQCSTLTGGSAPFSNMQPFLALNFCIALIGNWPSRA